MKRRISISLKATLYEKLQARSKKAGVSASVLIRGWLGNCSDIKYVNIHRASINSTRAVNYNIFLKEELIEAIGRVSHELGITRSTLIENIIESNLTEASGKPPILSFEDWYEKIDRSLPLKQLIKDILNKEPFDGDKISTGLYLREGNLVKMVGVAGHYYRSGVSKLLPIPFTFIKFDITRDSNLVTLSVRTKQKHITTNLRDTTAPLLIPSIWDNIQKFINIKLLVGFPLFYKGEVIGVNVVSFFTSTLELDIMKKFEVYNAKIGELIGKKLEYEKNQNTSQAEQINITTYQ